MPDIQSVLSITMVKSWCLQIELNKFPGDIWDIEWKYSDVNEHSQQMKNLMMETAKDECGMSKGS